MDRLTADATGRPGRTSGPERTLPPQEVHHDRVHLNLNLHVISGEPLSQDAQAALASHLQGILEDLAFNEKLHYDVRDVRVKPALSETKTRFAAIKLHHADAAGYTACTPIAPVRVTREEAELDLMAEVVHDLDASLERGESPAWGLRFMLAYASMLSAPSNEARYAAWNAAEGAGTAENGYTESFHYSLRITELDTLL